MTSGILLLDKPPGLTSNDALQRVRRAFGRIKAGHTGSLDPLATGMLPICLGEATKIAGDLLEGRKAYQFTARLGASTTTGDLEGELLETAPVPEDIHARLAVAAQAFLGPSQQVPPMYSALKREGPDVFEGFVKRLVDKDFEQIDEFMYERMTTAERRELEDEVLKEAREAAQAKFRQRELARYSQVWSR